MIKLTVGDKIKIGSKVVYIQNLQTYFDRKNHEKYTDVDVSKAVGIVTDIFYRDSEDSGIARTYEVEFLDNSFLPEPIQNVTYWYIPTHALELW